MRRVLALGCLVLAGASSAGGTASSPHETVFRDSTTEISGGPDITTVAVSSDGITLSFHIAIPTNPTVTPDSRLRIWLDADNSLDTGLDVEGPSGFDHFVLVDPTRFRPDEAVLYGCTGGTNVCSPAGAPLDFAYASGATLTIDARSLGLPRIERLRFYVIAHAGIRYDPATGYDLRDVRIDTAPNEGSWTYDARALRVTGFRSAPSAPRAGRSLALAMQVVRTDTGGALTRGKVTCSLRVGERDVPARTSRFVGRSATCAFDVPADTAGRRYRATIGVAARDAVVKRSISGRVR